MLICDVLFAYNSLDLKTLFLEKVELLLRIVPSEQELKAYRAYERECKPTSLLSEEDQFMICVCVICCCMHYPEICYKLTTTFICFLFSAQQHICYSTLCAIARPSVGLFVCHTGGSVRRLKLGSCNLHHRVAPSL